MNPDDFVLKDGKATLVQPCLEVVAFASAPAEESGEGFATFLRAFAERYGPRATFYMTGDMKRMRAYDADALEGPFHWFADPGVLGTKKLAFELHSGAGEKAIAPPALQLSLMGFDDPPCFVFRAALPAGEGEAPEDVVAFVREAFASFPLDCGHVGYSLLWDRHDRLREKALGAWMAPLLLRHPGLGYGSAVQLSNANEGGVVAVSWLTLLGPRLAGALGGAAALKRRAAKTEVKVEPLGAGGVLLRAGDAPQLGDVNRQDLVPAYHAAGRLVAARRASDDAFQNVRVLGMTDEQADDWLRRFFV